MFCKWCGTTIKTTEKKCPSCGRETPALSDCGGFYDLKRPWEAATPPPEAAAMPVDGHGGPNPAVVRQLVEENKSLRKKASTRNLIMILISACLVMALVVTVVLLLRSRKEEATVATQPAATVEQEEIPETVGPETYLLGVTVEQAQGEAPAQVTTLGGFDAQQTFVESNQVTVNFIRWKRETPEEVIPTEPEVTEPSTTAPSESVETTGPSDPTATAPSEPAVTEPGATTPGIVATNVSAITTPTAPTEEAATTAPSDPSDPTATAPSETTEPEATEPVPEGPQPVEALTPELDMDKVEMITLVLGWQETVTGPTEEEPELPESKSVTLEANLITGKMAQFGDATVTYSWEYTLDGETWFVVSEEYVENGRLTFTEAWWLAETPEGEAEITAIGLRCRITAENEKQDTLILVADGFWISQDLKVTNKPQPEAFQ